MIKDPFYKPLIGTTQAIDLVRGGVKTNALPEEAWAVVNHRIATQRSVFCIQVEIQILIYLSLTWGFANSSVAAVQKRDASLLKHLAKEFNLTYTAFGSVISTEDGLSVGTLTLTDSWGTALEPAPTTPTGEDSAPWQLLSGTIKATYNAHRGQEGEDTIIVSPGTATGNTGGCSCLISCYDEVDEYGTWTTDTRHYWKLTRHIVRYNHHYSGNNLASRNNVHTVNERVF